MFETASNRLKAVYRCIRRSYRLRRSRVNNTFRLEDYRTGDKRCLFVMHTGVKGGAPVLGKHIITALSGRGYQIITIVMEPGELVDDFCQLGYVFLPRSRRQLASFIDRLAGMGIHDAVCNSAMTGSVIPLLERYHFHIVSLVHEMPEIFRKNCVKYRLDHMIRHSHELIFPSSVVRDLCLSYSGVPTGGHVTVHPQGLFLKGSGKKDKQEAYRWIAARHGIAGNPEIVLNVASTSYRKGLDLFLDACRMDRERVYLWVGIKENAYYQQCIKAVGQENIPNFIPVGYVSSADELAVYYQAASVLAMTSREEPFGSIVLESFAMGTPVAAIDGCGGFVDIVHNGTTGYLAREISGAAVLEAINSITQNKAQYRQMSQNCIRKAEEMSFDEYVTMIERRMRCAEKE